MRHVVVAALSARSLARSALAAGWTVSTLDGFGDRDLVEPGPAPRAHRTVAPFSPAAAAAAAPASDAAAYAAPFENAPAAVATLATGRRLLGNPPAVLDAVRCWERVAAALERAGLPVARALDVAGAARAVAALRKPRRGGGGRGVVPWDGSPLAEGEFLQERVAGVPASFLFVADGRDLVPLGVTRQLVGQPAFGADGFRWCGNLLGPEVLPDQAAVAGSAERAARVLVRAFGLVGVNGIDFVAQDGTAAPIEVNPRWTGAVELVERASGTTLFPAHVAGCEGRLPAVPGPGGAVHGKAVVFAPAALVVPDTDGWLAERDVADIPASGSRVPAGAPLCSAFGTAPTAATCLERLEARATRLVAACRREPRP